jgi:hypothetical protein
MGSFSIRDHTVLAGALFIVSACQISPYDNQIFQDISSIQFEGCSISPNDVITLQTAGNFDQFDSSLWTNFGTIARSSSTVSATDSTGRKWYCWSNSVNIPLDSWGQDIIQHYPNGALFGLHIRVLDNGSPVWTFENPAGNCPSTGAAAFTGSPPCAVSSTQSGGGKFNDGSMLIYAQHAKQYGL